MKKIALLISLFTFLVVAANAQTPRPGGAGAAAAPQGGTGAEGKIAIINSSAFNSEVLELRAKLEAFRVELEPKQKEIETISKQIEDIKGKLQTQSTTLNDATRNQLLEQGQELEKTLKRKSEDYESMVQRRGGELTQPVYEKIQKALTSYASTRGIAIVIDGVSAQQNGLLLYAQQTTDITDDFIKEYNKANPAAAAPAKK